jgi:hypothetical protein
VDVQVHIFFTSALVGGYWSASRPGRVTPEERASSTHWIGGWVGPRVGLEDMEKRKISPLTGFEFKSMGCPARSQSLSRLQNRVQSHVKCEIDDRRNGTGVNFSQSCFFLFSPANQNSTVGPYSSVIAPLMCVIPLSRQRIIIFLVLKFGASALTRHLSRHTVRDLSTFKCMGLLRFSKQSALIS